MTDDLPSLDVLALTTAIAHKLKDVNESIRLRVYRPKDSGPVYTIADTTNPILVTFLADLSLSPAKAPYKGLAGHLAFSKSPSAPVTTAVIDGVANYLSAHQTSMLSISVSNNPTDAITSGMYAAHRPGVRLADGHLTIPLAKP